MELRRRTTRAAATSTSPTRSSAKDRSTSSTSPAGSPTSSSCGATSRFAHFLRRLSSFSRLILFDKRGTGLSDHVPTDQLPTLEQRMDDVRAVLDAVGSERAALFGHSEGGTCACSSRRRTRSASPRSRCSRSTRSASGATTTRGRRRRRTGGRGEAAGGARLGRGRPHQLRAESSNDAEFKRWLGAWMRNGASLEQRPPCSV